MVLIFNWLFCFCVSSFYMLGPSQISEYPEATVVMYVWPLYPTGQTQPLTFNLPCDLPLMDYCSCSSELWNINCTEESRQDSTILTLRAIWYAITLKSHFHLETLLEISVFAKLFTTNYKSLGFSCLTDCPLARYISKMGFSPSTNSLNKLSKSFRIS